MILAETVFSIRFFSPSKSKAVRIMGRIRGRRCFRQKNVLHKMNVNETKNENFPKIQLTRAPPSRGATGIRLKRARARFSSGHMPKKYMIRLKNGPAPRMKILRFLSGTDDRLSIHPQGRSRKEETFSFKIMLTIQ